MAITAGTSTVEAGELAGSGLAHAIAQALETYATTPPSQPWGLRSRADEDTDRRTKVAALAQAIATAIAAADA